MTNIGFSIESFFYPDIRTIFGKSDLAYFVVGSLNDRCVEFNHVRDYYALFAVKSRVNLFDNQVNKWIQRHYENGFKEIIQSNNIFERVELCKNKGVEILVADNAKDAEVFAKSGIHVLLPIEINKEIEKHDFKELKKIEIIPSLFDIKHFVDCYVESKLK